VVVGIDYVESLLYTALDLFYKLSHSGCCTWSIDAARRLLEPSPSTFDRVPLDPEQLFNLLYERDLFGPVPSSVVWASGRPQLGELLFPEVEHVRFDGQKPADFAYRVILLFKFRQRRYLCLFQPLCIVLSVGKYTTPRPAGSTSTGCRRPVDMGYAARYYSLVSFYVVVDTGFIQAGRFGVATGWQITGV